MSNKITPSELRNRISDAFPDHGAVTDGTLTHIARALGYELEPERPEPGTIGVSHMGRPAFVDHLGEWRVIRDDGAVRAVHELEIEPVPARVVPAEPVELSEEEVGEVWDSLPRELGGGYTRASWADLKDGARAALWTEFARTLLAKHGHGGRKVSREQVAKAVADGYQRPGVLTTNVIDAVMALLEGGNK